MTVGVAVGGTVFQNLMSQKLSGLGLPTEIAHNAEGFIKIMKQMKVSDPVRMGATQAYVHGFQGVWITITVLSGAGLLASLFIKRHNMDKILDSAYRLSR